MEHFFKKPCEQRQDNILISDDSIFGKILKMRDAGSSDNEIIIRLSGLGKDPSPEEAEELLGSIDTIH